MGGSQSAHRVSISREREDEAFNIVRISEDAIRTLRGERIRPPDTQTIEITKEEPQKTVPVIDDKLKFALNEERLLTQRLRQDLLQSQQQLKELKKKLEALEHEGKEATLDAAVIETDKVKKAEVYYREKLNELLERERERELEATKIFKQRVEELQQRFLKYSCHTACAEVESKVLQCYLQNPRQPLRCSRDGDEFIQCVDEYRAKMLTAKEFAVSAN